MAKVRIAWQVKAVAVRFREERERKGYSARAFASIFLEVSRSCLSKLESGAARLEAHHFDVAARCGMDVGYIVNGKRSTQEFLASIEEMIGYATIGARIAEARHG